MFKFMCDRCGKFIKNVSGNEAKDIMLENDMICDSCKKMESRLSEEADKLKRKWDAKINELIRECKTELVDTMEAIKSE